MGKPVFIMTYSQITCLFIATFLINIISLAYCLKTFSSAFSIKQNVGVYIDMISDDGHILPTLLVIPGLLCLPANLLCSYLVCKAFSEKKKPLINNLMFVLVFVLSGIICISLVIAVMVLSHAYSLHESLHDGITEAMNNYSSNSLFKTRIDKLQIKFQCCGSRKYQEWYNITWYDTNVMKNSINKKSTPFSCCSIKSRSLCIHHGIESSDLAYQYSRDKNFSVSAFGCANALSDKKKSTGWSIVGRIMTLFVLELAAVATLRLFQSGHSKEYRYRYAPLKTYRTWIFGTKISDDSESRDSHRSHASQ